MVVPPASLLAQGVPNPWFDATYLRLDTARFLAALEQHVTITVVAVLAGLVVSLPLALVARRGRLAEVLVVGGTGVIYTVPSLALFGFLVPVTGLTALTAEIALALYSLVVLVRNTLAGLALVPREVLQAARAMGMGPVARLVRVELPLALPSIMAGVRIATVSTIALLTVAAYVGTGGFGQLIDEGFRADYKAKVTTASLACVVLALVADALLLGLQRLLTPWTRVRT